MEVSIPETFARAPRWRHDAGGRAWVDSLGGTVATVLREWGLTLDGVPRHGSNAVVYPVRTTGGIPAVLRLTPPDVTAAASLRAMLFWQGNPAMVRFLRCSEAGDQLLLERLDSDQPLSQLSPIEQADVLGSLVTELAQGDPPSNTLTTGYLAETFARLAQRRWQSLGRPFDESLLRHAEEFARGLQAVEHPRPANGDVHPDQALRRRDRWVMIDPVLLSGDPAYDLARILWDTADRLRGPDGIRAQAHRLADATASVTEQPLAWMYVRTIDYWLWCLGVGLTQDPFRCRAVADALRDM